MSKMKNTIPETQELLVVGSVILLSRVESSRESVLFIGTQFSILYTFVYSPA